MQSLRNNIAAVPHNRNARDLKIIFERVQYLESREDWILAFDSLLCKKIVHLIKELKTVTENQLEIARYIYSTDKTRILLKSKFEISKTQEILEKTRAKQLKRENAVVLLREKTKHDSLHLNQYQAIDEALTDNIQILSRLKQQLDGDLTLIENLKAAPFEYEKKV